MWVEKYQIPYMSLVRFVPDPSVHGWVMFNLIPVFTVILAALFLGERPTLLQVAGMFLVLGGVFLAGSVRRPSPAAAAAD